MKHREHQEITDYPQNGLLCSVCGEPQYRTPSGATCASGNHGGALGVAPEDAPGCIEEPDEGASALAAAVRDGILHDHGPHRLIEYDGMLFILPEAAVGKGLSKTGNRVSQMELSAHATMVIHLGRRVAKPPQLLNEEEH